jgi:methionyl-tRNA formyltransferase
MKVLFFGNGEAGIHCLKIALKKRYILDMLVVVPFGGKKHPWHASIRQFCLNKNIKFIEPEHVNSRGNFRILKKFSPDVIFSVYYTQILSKEILDLGKYAVNFHPSLLPKYRGTAPLIWAIINNEKKTGITAHEMTSSIDKGKIYFQKEIDILDDDTGYSLHKKVAKKCSEIFEEVLENINKKKLEYFFPSVGGSYYSSSSPKVNRLDPKIQTKRQIYNIVRALTKPLPMAYLLFQGKKYYINKVIPYSGKIYHPKDSYLVKSKGNLYIIAKDGILKVMEYYEREE